jgi:hypothetical protein
MIHMKPTLASLFTIALIACGIVPSASAQSHDPAYGTSSYSKYSTGNYADSPKNSPLRKMTTAQLQQKRLDLYKTVPQGQTHHGNPYFVYHGTPLPQQQEILAIEAELRRRFDAGDKSAAWVRPIPGGIHP